MNKEHQRALAVSGIALALTVYLVKRVSDKKNKKYKEIPYPTGSTNWPIFGNHLFSTLKLHLFFLHQG